MRIATGLLVAAMGLGAARFAREALAVPRDVDDAATEEPYTPSPSTAPFLALGYREAVADLLYVRLRGYFGEFYEATANGIASLAEAISALDPKFHAIYDYAANAMTIAPHGVDQSTFHRAIALLQQGMNEFPDDWRLPYVAGQMYTQDLKTDNPVQRRAWDERGVLLVESAIRKPGAPIDAAGWVAVRRSRLGEKQRAIDGLRELLLVTPEGRAHKDLLKRLAKLEHTQATDAEAEIYEMRHEFEDAWHRERPAVNASMYLLLGPHPEPGFDMTDLATGGHDIVGSTLVEPLEPVK